MQDIFRDVFDDDSIVLKETDSAENIGGWDSMAQIMLVAAVERHFGVKFGLAETREFHTAGDIARAVREKASLF